MVVNVMNVNGGLLIECSILKAVTLFVSDHVMPVSWRLAVATCDDSVFANLARVRCPLCTVANGTRVPIGGTQRAG